MSVENQCKRRFDIQSSDWRSCTGVSGACIQNNVFHRWRFDSRSGGGGCGAWRFPASGGLSRLDFVSPTEEASPFGRGRIRLTSFVPVERGGLEEQTP